MKNILKKLLIIAFWLLLWAAAAFALNRSLLITIPTPFSTLQALIRLGQTSEFYLSALLSLGRILLGFAAAVVLGSTFGILSHQLPFFRELTQPVLHCVRAIPVASFIILIFLWFDKDVIPILIAALMVIPVIWDNAAAAFAHIDGELLEMAKVMGLPKGKIWSKIIFPAVRPGVSAALMTGLGIAWKAGVSAEIICRSGLSLGNMMWVEKNAIAYDEVFALTAVVVLLSILMETLMKAILKGGGDDRDQ